MASSTSLAAAMQAYVDEDYASAEEHYSAALAEAKPGDGGDDAELLAGRAAARLALEDFLGAADDARRAVAASPGLAKAHMRRGIALFHLEEFESSRDALNRAVELFQEQDKGAAAGKGGKSSGNGGSGGGGSGGGGSGASARKWLQRAEAALAAEEKEKEKEAEEGGVAVAAARAPAPAPAAAGKEALPRATLPSPPPPPPQAQQQQQQQPPPPQQQPPPCFRHQWFQTSDAVEVGVLAKGLKQEAVRVQVEPRRLLVVIDGDDGESPSSSASGPSAAASAASAASASPSPPPAPPRFALDLALAGEVVPEKCRHAVLSTKVEVRLHKAAPGLAWPSLERKGGGEGAAGAADAAPPPPPLPLAPAPAAAAAAADGSSSAPSPVDDKRKKPSYPSSNPKHTDWDELDRKLEEEEKRAEEEEGGGGGGGPEQGEEALLKLFRSVYSGGDDDVRRAMSKSFVESGGEVLSTSWSDVSAGRRMPGGDGDEDEGCCDKGCGGGGGSCGHRH